MSDKSNGIHDKRSTVSDWKRPPGPPNVWRIVEGKEKLDESTTRPIRFSIQEISEDRYEEVAEFMCKYFLPDEATCQSFKIMEDDVATNDFRQFWKFLLKSGISVGAFVLDSDDKISELAGVNVIFVVTTEFEKSLNDVVMTFKSPKSKKITGFLNDISQKVDVYKIYGVDKYISAMGLSVKPTFRGQRLGVHLLEVRNDIGRKYGISATSTIFTGPSSQIQAKRAGFETALTQEYAEILDEDGKPLFPNIRAKEMKIMIKRLQ